MKGNNTQTLSSEDPGLARAGDQAGAWPLYARSLGQLLDLSVDLFVACLTPTVGLTFLMWLPVRFVWVILGSGGTQDATAQWVFGLFANSTVQALSAALVIQIVYAQLQGRPQSAGQALMAALRRAPALLLCASIVALGTGIGTACCFVPGVFLMFLWSAAPSALVLEGLGPVEALRRSQQLVRKQFPRWLGITVFALLLKLPYDAVVVLLDMPSTAQWALQELGAPALAYKLAQVFVTSLLLAVSSAAWAIVATTFYLDCRVRLEGFDLAMRLERLQANAMGGRGRIH